MGSKVILSLIVAVLATFAYMKVKPFFEVPQKPDLGEKWWKTTKPAKEDTSIRPFKIEVSHEVLQDLRERLNRTLPLQKSLEGAKQHYGMNDKLLKTVVDFWKTKYDWKEREKLLNQYPHFKTSIQGLDIHFIHVKPQKTQGLKVLPLLLLHGWPGSIKEFYGIIPLLTTPKGGQKFVFELIIPSLPGFGFSEGAEVAGLSSIHMATIFKNLMARLGFEKYYIQGGDVGSVIVDALSTFYPEKISGVHSTNCLVNTPSSNLKLMLGSLWPSLIVEEKYQHLVYPRMEFLEFCLLEFGYFHIQATKPDTIVRLGISGTGLRDSPVGLAAYILEKFTTWTNRDYKDLEDGGLTKKYKMEELLDNVMIYWVTRSITTSQRVYAETVNKEILSIQIDMIPNYVPSACARFTRDLFYFPDSILRDKHFNLVQATTHEGGHFAAFEVRQILAEDVIEFVGKVEKSLESVNK